MKITILAAAAFVAWNADLQKRPVPTTYETWIAEISAAHSASRDVSPEAAAFAAWSKNFPAK